MSLDKKFFKEQIGAIGESSIKPYYSPTVEQRDKETCRIFAKWRLNNIKESLYQFFKRKIKSYFIPYQ